MGMQEVRNSCTNEECAVHKNETKIRKPITDTYTSGVSQSPENLQSSNVLNVDIKDSTDNLYRKHHASDEIIEGFRGRKYIIPTLTAYAVPRRCKTRCSCSTLTIGSRCGRHGSCVSWKEQRTASNTTTRYSSTTECNLDSTCNCCKHRRALPVTTASKEIQTCESTFRECGSNNGTTDEKNINRTYENGECFSKSNGRARVKETDDTNLGRPVSPGKHDLHIGRDSVWASSKDVSVKNWVESSQGWKCEDKEAGRAGETAPANPATALKAATSEGAVSSRRKKSNSRRKNLGNRCSVQEVKKLFYRIDESRKASESNIESSHLTVAEIVEQEVGDVIRKKQASVLYKREYGHTQKDPQCSERVKGEQNVLERKRDVNSRQQSDKRVSRQEEQSTGLEKTPTIVEEGKQNSRKVVKQPRVHSNLAEERQPLEAVQTTGAKASGSDQAKQRCNQEFRQPRVHSKLEDERQPLEAVQTTAARASGSDQARQRSNNPSISCDLARLVPEERHRRESDPRSRTVTLEGVDKQLPKSQRPSTSRKQGSTNIPLPVDKRKESFSRRTYDYLVATAKSIRRENSVPDPLRGNSERHGRREDFRRPDDDSDDELENLSSEGCSSVESTEQQIDRLLVEIDNIDVSEDEEEQQLEKLLSPFLPYLSFIFYWGNLFYVIYKFVLSPGTSAD